MTSAASTQNQTDVRQQKDCIEIIYYTDPFCCWSWALEPQWRRLRYEFGDQLNWKYVMGGLIPDWRTYRDPMNSINRPAQMGPLWMEASQVSGMPIQDELWTEDPPASSYPACIAVKTAELQSEVASEVFLRAAREALMIESKDISNRQVLFDIASLTENRFPDFFSAEQFKSDYNEQAGYDAFRADIMQVRFNKIGRFPTLVLKAAGKASLLITGYRPYSVLLDALLEVSPGIRPVNDINNTKDYIDHWKFLTARELKEVSG